MNAYDEFANHGGGFRYRKHFWYAVRHFQRALEEIEPSSRFIWNKFTKIGKDGSESRPSREILAWQEPWFDAVTQEILVFRPDIVLFLSGTDYVTDKIQRANLDGSAVEDLVTGLSGPYGIALDLPHSPSPRGSMFSIR